mgnify:CR=1 FL=1
MRKLIINLYKIKILKRLVPSALKIFLRIVNKYNIIINHNNLLVNLNLRNPIDREIYLKDSYENNQIEYLKKLIIQEKLEIFIDIGSHMGFYSINLSKLVKKTYSFEPILENFNQLKKNIEINNYKNVEIYNLALSNKKEKVDMWVPDKDRTGGFSIYNKSDEELKVYKPNSIHKEKVLCNILDEILNFKNKKIAIKIDVERHEKSVIEGAINLLKKNNVLLQIEIFENRKKEVFEILKMLNYKLINVINKDHYFQNY